MVGFGANRRGGRLPSFILIALMVVILILSFNYWTVSNKHTRLLDELAEVQTQVKRTDAARSRLEKRNSELMVQVDAHRKQIDQKDGDFNTLESKLRACETQVRRCTDDKAKMESEVTAQTSEIQRLTEQLKELRQEFIKQEEQLREVKGNSTYLERKLEYESLQCGRQIAQLKEDYEDKKKKLEGETAKLKQSLLGNRLSGAVGGHADRAAEGQNAGERHTETAKHQDGPELKVGLGKLASDAGMPGIEDSEVGKLEEMQFALKKPAITRNQAGHVGDTGVKEDTAGAGAGAGAGPDLQKAGGALAGAALEQVGAGNGALPQQRVQQPPPPAQGDKPVLFDEDRKAGVRADELGESRRGPDGGKADGLDAKGMVLPPPPNPAHVLPNPMEQQHARDAPPAQPPRHRQSRFFDENESPVDPQHGSKLADYNGDDGNVGEYEADKQAELAYNEEEDGDGGEEDVQDDEDRELQGDRPVDYGKRHQAIDIL
ncbi:protein GOLM2 isoform X1 [Anguilla rostrata]|uniref:protein GOLM2 isoform X1 n=1 Tax=Anguilla rostrata TaxID=7938 RepID=UPI0030CE3FD2